MRVPARVAAVSCLCPLVVFLCVVSQSCYGTQVNLSPHANPNPSLYPNQRLSNKLSSLTSPHQSSNTSGNINYTTYNSRPAALSNPKSHTKLRPSSQTNRNGKSDSRGTNTYSRAQKNQTKLFDTDKDSHHRPKRGWIWNQFFVLEEHIGPEPQYIGKYTVNVNVNNEYMLHR
ncbi:Hypothetical protein SMAX5B_016288 [Scophthalmus maximus]|uniref:Uncharacterized protein n=1 Tax=Scophthalmus maximus TaxID=52904 RepID=A0A2U9BL31_SCOMX|nr:Hypothetical protein SMAX5B_016288 [Scophthalmus maximus]AWP04738.1 Hypothetical protein SMAX5B_016288 [Scophthalmus maximus]